MKDAYVGKTLYGHIVMFAEHDGEVLIYRLDNTRNSKIKIAMSDWEEKKKSYDASSDVGSYDDIVNAAWQCIGWNDALNKASVKKLDGKPGIYFPRIWRGIYEDSAFHCYNAINARSTYGSQYIGANVATSSIFDAIEALFRYVEPSKDNLSAYGHRIREVLILACMEVESAWRSILEANCSNKKTHYTTNDYSNLLEPLRLAEWSVSLKDYPHLGNHSPFHLWDKTKPTQSLVWYDAYNAVKHHREEKFAESSLGNVIAAAAALHIMNSAQFGPEIYSRFFGNQRSPFSLAEHPKYDLSAVYVSDFVGGGNMSAALYFG